MPELTAEEVIEAYGLQPLEGEGGFFRQTWIRAGEHDEAPVGTCILYLVTPDSFSALHRLMHDEIFHFYMGDPCKAVAVDGDGLLSEVVLGHDIRTGMRVQHVVPAGSWQGTRLATGGVWALLGTTMAPGFHPSGFELATTETVESFTEDIASKVREFIAPQP